MIKLKVSINGEQVCIAGEGDLSVLCAVLSAVGYLGPDSFHESSELGEKKITMNIGGGASAREEEDYKDYNWLEQDIKIGDKIELEFVDDSEKGSAALKIQSFKPQTLDEVEVQLKSCQSTIQSCEEQIQSLNDTKEKMTSKKTDVD
jgi:hypothetical protein